MAHSVRSDFTGFATAAFTDSKLTVTHAIIKAAADAVTKTIQSASIRYANLIRIYMKTIIAQFVLHPQKDQYATGHADGQPCNIDGGKSLVTDDVPECNFKIVLYHSNRSGFAIVCTKKILIADQQPMPLGRTFFQFPEKNPASRGANFHSYTIV